MNNKLKNSGIVKFACKVSEKEDAFGIRAWQDDNYKWSEMGFYVSFHEGNLCYYINGSFYKIMEFEPNKWYEFEIDFNTDYKKYDIAINGNKLATDVSYSGHPDKLSLFQILAFSNASCKKAYIYDITIPVEFVKSASVNQNIPERACMVKE